MKCQHCGAEYDDRSPVCPYCQSENIQEAERRKKEALAAYDKEALQMRKEMEGYAKKKARTLTWWILRITGILFLAAALITAGILIAGKLWAGHSYKRDQAHLEKLNEMYVQGDYAGIAEYVKENELWSVSYEKYEQIYYVQNAYDRFLEQLTQLKQLSEETVLDREKQIGYIESSASYAADDACYVLSKSAEYAKDAAILGNEACMEQFYELCTQTLLQLGCTGEETEEATLSEDGGKKVIAGRIRDYYVKVQE